MRVTRAVLVFALCCAVAPLAHTASAPSLWAFDVGPEWAAGVSLTVAVDPFSRNAAAFPPGRSHLMDASYDPASSLLYVSGGFPEETWYVQNTIFVYSGGPRGLEFVSSSNAGMGDLATGYHWLAGIEYLNGSLYAIGYTGWTEENVLLRIDNPGTPAQTVTEIGTGLGPYAEMGTGFALCGDGQGGLFATFYRFPDYCGTTLYTIDPTTGVAILLHTYPAEPSHPLYDKAIEGLTLCGDSLYGVTTSGRLVRIDPNTYEATVLGELGSGIWTGLTTIPEPSALGLLALALVAGLRWLSWR